MTRISITILLALCVSACKKSAPTESSKASPTVSAQPAPAGAFLTVGAYCTAFCGKLCGTCGDAACPDTCKPRCLFNRAPDMVMDGKDPKVALALTQKNLDGCLAEITAESCPKIMAGQVPPTCYTIQH